MGKAQSEWNKRNPEVMRAAQDRYRQKHPGKVVEQNRARSDIKRNWAKLKRYGVTQAEFLRRLERQRFCCAGCNQSVDLSACLDHDHERPYGHFRGILCRNCNWALGNVGEQSETLYQLAAYLELDKTNPDRHHPIVYIIGSLRNPEIPHIGNALRALGIEAIDNWFAASERADSAWQEYSTLRQRSFSEALESREAKHVFNFDRAYLNLSDAVVLVYPAGKSAGLEFGYAIGQGLSGYILIEQDVDRYDVMLQFAGCPIFHNRQALLEALTQDFALEQTRVSVGNPLPEGSIVCN